MATIKRLQLRNEFSGLWYGAYRYSLKRLAKQFEIYQPITMDGTVLGEGERGCADRWNLIREQITAYKCRTVMDIGCAEGYFVHRAAEQCGCVALGVDADVRRLTMAHSAATLSRLQGAAFMYAEVSPEFIQQLPSFDLVIFMSVLHHIMYADGVERAREYMRAIREKARVVIFDMGQSNETQSAWSASLPDMGADPPVWIRQFLLDCGYSEAVQIGKTDAYNSPVSRAVFRLHT